MYTVKVLRHWKMEEWSHQKCMLTHILYAFFMDPMSIWACGDLTPGTALAICYIKHYMLNYLYIIDFVMCSHLGTRLK